MKYGAFGLVEVLGSCNAVMVIDQMLKTADVSFRTWNGKCGGHEVVFMSGDVSAVTAAVESVKQNPNCEVIKFLGIDDISLTDEILKKEVYVNRNEINVDYLLIELMNMDVYDNDKLIGKVKEILLNKKYNYIKVHDIIIPITNNFIEKMDFENNIIYVKNMGDLNEN